MADPLLGELGHAGGNGTDEFIRDLQEELEEEIKASAKYVQREIQSLGDCILQASAHKVSTALQAQAKEFEKKCSLAGKLRREAQAQRNQECGARLKADALLKEERHKTQELERQVEKQRRESEEFDVLLKEAYQSRESKHQLEKRLFAAEHEQAKLKVELMLEKQHHKSEESQRQLERSLFAAEQAKLRAERQLEKQKSEAREKRDQEDAVVIKELQRQVAAGAHERLQMMERLHRHARSCGAPGAAETDALLAELRQELVELRRQVEEGQHRHARMERAGPSQRGSVKVVLKDGCLQQGTAACDGTAARKEPPPPDSGNICWKSKGHGSPALGSVPQPESGEPAPNVRKFPFGSLALDREVGEGVRLEDREGEPPCPEQCGSQGEQPLDRAAHRPEIRGPDSFVVAPSPARHANLEHAEEAPRFVKHTALEHAEEAAGTTPKTPISVDGQVLQGGGGAKWTAAAKASAAPLAPISPYIPRSRLAAFGPLNFWTVTVRKGRFDPEGLRLLRHPPETRRPLAQTPRTKSLEPFSFLPLQNVQGGLSEAVVIGRLLLDSTKLQVIFLGSPDLYLDRGKEGCREAGGIEVSLMERDRVPELASAGPRPVAAVDMTQAQRAATEALLHGGSPQRGGPRWWVVTVSAEVPVREKPEIRADVLLKKQLHCRKGEIILALELEPTPGSETAWVELADPAIGYMCKYNPENNPPELLKPLKGRDDLLLVLQSWDEILAVMNRLLSVEYSDARMTTSQKIHRIADLNADLGRLAKQEESNGLSKGHATAKLTFRRRSREAVQYVMHLDHASPSDGMQGILSFLNREKSATAREVFARQDLSPKLVREGPGWRMEEEAGKDLYKVQAELAGSLKLPTRWVHKLARLIARKDLTLGTQWFDDFRDMYRDLLPELRGTPEASHVWLKVASGDKFARKASPEERRRWAEWRFEPVASASKRLVTCHGDVHWGQRSNVLVSDDELVFIDHESSCVTWAIEDLARAVQPFLSCPPNPPNTRARFLRAYLKEVRADAATEEELDEEAEKLLFDVLSYRMIMESMSSKPKRAKSEKMLEVYDIARKRDSDHAKRLWRQVVESDFETAAKYHEQRMLEEKLV